MENKYQKISTVYFFPFTHCACHIHREIFIVDEPKADWYCPKCYAGDGRATMMMLFTSEKEALEWAR